MSEPQLIVVAGVPVKSHEEITYNWAIALFAAHLMYFIYMCNVYDDKNELMSLSFSFLICGVYLPFYGYNAVKKNKQGALRFFTIILPIISLLGIVSALSSIGFYYELTDICDDCEDVFEDGGQDCNVSFARDGQLYLTADECSKIPDESIFITQHALSLAVNIIGMITACMTTAKRKHATIAQSVPTLFSTDTPVSVITIEGEQVVARTEDVPEITTV
jgi:hypothetical protein